LLVRETENIVKLVYMQSLMQLQIIFVFMLIFTAGDESCRVILSGYCLLKWRLHLTHTHTHTHTHTAQLASCWQTVH